MNSFSPPVPVDPDLDARDQWDCLVSFIVAHKGEASLQDELKKHLGHFESPGVCRRWCSGTGGVDEPKPPPAKLFDDLRRWIYEAVGSKADLAAANHRATFYRTYKRVPKAPFRFVGRQRELAELAATLEQARRVCIAPSAADSEQDVAGESPKHVTAPGRKQTVRQRDRREEMRRRTGGRHAAGLHGLGGQGKTAIARQYALSQRGNYAAIVWLEGASPLGIEEQLDRFARARAIKPTAADVAAPGNGNAADRLLGRLKAIAAMYRGRILLVCDGIVPSLPDQQAATSAEARLTLLLGALPDHVAIRYHVLLTSRHRLNIPSVVTVPITRMTKRDAVALFTTRSGIELTADNRKQLEQLVDEQLGGHPLTITLLAAFARTKRYKRVDALAALVRGRLVDAEDPEEGQYMAPLRAIFDMSFDTLSDPAKLLLLTLGLLRRTIVDVETLRACAQRMRPKTEPVSALQEELTRKGGANPSLRALVRLALAEQVQVPGEPLGRVSALQLHEVIYDFAHFEWARLQAEQKWTKRLLDLELSWTRGAVAHASEAVSNATLEFKEIDALAGMLLPAVHPERRIFPAQERIAAALTFWYDHFVFQNFVYDTGLQDGLLGQMIALRDYLKSQRELTPRFELLLEKMIGHAYYADPAATGQLAVASFDRALELAKQLDAERPRGEGEISTARWYQLFLLDHRSNVASKQRPREQLTAPIRDTPVLRADLDAIEHALPAALRSLDAPPRGEKVELLLRAAHYWGHRGNQDGFIQMKRLVDKKLGEADPISADARDHYIRAANYRLAALVIFRRKEFRPYLSRATRRRDALPFVVPWLEHLEGETAGPRLESFTSLSQGVGDTAHQYRGLHLVFTIDFLASTSPERRTQLASQAQQALRSARTLWNISKQVLKPYEAMLRYQLWMCMAEVLQGALDHLVAGRQLPSLDDALKRLRASSTDMQATMRSSYQFSVDDQERQLRELWPFIAAAGHGNTTP